MWELLHLDSEIFLKIWDPKLWNCGILAFGLTLTNIQGSDARIERVVLGLGDKFRSRWVLGWFLRGFNLVLAFLGIELVSCDFHWYRVNETSNSCFLSSFESGTSIIIDLHLWFVCTGFQMNLEGEFDILRVSCVF